MLLHPRIRGERHEEAPAFPHQGGRHEDAPALLHQAGTAGRTCLLVSRSRRGVCTSMRTIRTWVHFATEGFLDEAGGQVFGAGWREGAAACLAISVNNLQYPTMET